ncbi:hypothetical protein IAT40_003903 [Kwoniella sp. CBS 6097]
MPSRSLYRVVSSLLFLANPWLLLVLASPTLLPLKKDITVDIERRQDPNPFPTQSGSNQESPHGSTITATPSPNPSASASATGNGGGGGGGGDGGIALEIILPIIILLAALVLLVILINYRVKIKAFLRKHFGLPSSATRLPHTSTRDSSRTLTAEQLSGHTTPNPSPNTNASDTNGASGNGGGGARDRRRRRDRNVRRTESGRSVRTLPVYSKEAGDEELVLVRQRSQSSFSDESYFEQDVTQSLGDAEMGLLASDRRPRSLSIRSIASRRRSSSQEQDDHWSGEENGNEGDIPLSTVREGIETSETLLSPLASPDPRVPQSAPLPLSRSSSNSISGGEQEESPLHQRGEFAHAQTSVHRSDSLGRRGWGEAPTYLEAMSSPLPPSAYNASTPSPASASANVPPPRDLRTRTSSTFRGLLSKAGFTYAPSRHDQQMSQSRTSSTSLLLQPTTSRLSAMSFRPNSPGTSPGASTLSLVISSPVPNTAVRASFDSARLPKAGLSDDQMRFLGSKEALNVAGVKLNEVPDQRKRRRRSEALSVDETLFGGRSRGESVSSTVGVGSAHERGGSDALDVGGNESLRRGSGSSVEVDEGRGQGLPPSWEQSENLRRQTQAFDRRNLAKPVNVEAEAAGVGPSSDHSAELDQRESESAAGALDSQGTAVPARQSSLPKLEVAATTPLPLSPTGTTHATSPVISLSTAPASASASASASALTSAPTLEIEPLTPIVSTPPPQPLLAGGRQIP